MEMTDSRSDDSLIIRLRQFFSGRRQPLALPPPSEPLPARAEPMRTGTPITLAGMFSAFALPVNFAETPSQALTNLLALLETFLDTSATPAPSVTAVSVIERAVGVGNRQGISAADPMGIVELKGGRLEAVVRFAIGGGDAGAVNSAIATLQGDLLAARDSLFVQRVLKVTALESSAAEEFPAGSGEWRRTADYRVLYEYQFASTDDAHGLIARIEVGEVGPGELMVITRADTVRWGNETAAELVLTHGKQVAAVDIWAFLPATFDGAAVTITATVNGVVTQQNFATLRAFVNAFDLESETVLLGTNAFSVGTMPFPNTAFPEPIVLGGANAFRITYADAAFTEDAIVYLRVRGG